MPSTSTLSLNLHKPDIQTSISNTNACSSLNNLPSNPSSSHNLLSQLDICNDEGDMEMSEFDSDAIKNPVENDIIDNKGD